MSGAAIYLVEAHSLVGLEKKPEKSLKPECSLKPRLGRASIMRLQAAVVYGLPPRHSVWDSTDASILQQTIKQPRTMRDLTGPRALLLCCMRRVARCRSSGPAAGTCPSRTCSGRWCLTPSLKVGTVLLQRATGPLPASWDSPWAPRSLGPSVPGPPGPPGPRGLHVVLCLMALYLLNESATALESLTGTLRPCPQPCLSRPSGLPAHVVHPCLSSLP